MKNIGIFIYDATLVGGAEVISLKLANELQGYYNVTVISLFNTNEKTVIELNKNIKYITLNQSIGSIPKNIVRYSRQLRVQLKENLVDILLGITAGINTIAYLATVCSKTKWAYCEHSNLENQTYGRLHFFRQLIGAYFSDTVVVLTERDRHNFIKTFKLTPSKVITIPNYFEASLSNKEYDINSKNIISVGRLVSIKQFEHIINIGQKLFVKHPDWSWHIYGMGEEYNKLFNLILQKGLEKHIILKGHCKNIIELLPQYSFFVMTSKYEGLPLVLLEGQSCKLPIVSYDCPTGPGEMIENEINGFLVKDQDQKDLLEKVCLLIESEEKRVFFSSKSFIKLEHYEKSRVISLWKGILS